VPETAAVNMQPPPAAIPRTVARFAGWIGDATELLSGRPFDLNSCTARYAYTTLRLSSDKAARELGYRSRPVAEAIDAAVEWFRRTGILV
jgi:dihydroflavonol-4-reductase